MTDANRPASVASSAGGETGRLLSVCVKHPRDAFESPARSAREWRALNFTAPPDFARACDEYDRWLTLLAESGAVIQVLPAGDDAGLDSIYTRDASVLTPDGVVLCRMGKAARSSEPAAQAGAYRAWRVPVVGAIEAPGQLEGGDVVWLDARTVAVGRGYRTNAAGLAQFRALAGESVTVIEVPLPHWRGQHDVFHLMSMISPVDRDLAVVYEPLLPVPFREALLDRGWTLVAVPDAEFETTGANVLALAPRHCLAVDGNPVTRRRLEAAGATVAVYAGTDICLKGGGGPTCLTRPLARASV
jgi:N-dimethylarginine dimethylaminohydrolase